MKRLILGCALSCAFVTASAPALGQSFGQGFGEIYFTTDLSDRTSLVEAAPFQLVTFYLAIEMTFADIGLPEQDLSNGFGGWEAKIQMPPQFTVTSRTLNPPSSINVGNDSEDNWIVGTGGTVTAASTPYGVVQYSGLLLAAATDLVLSIGPSEPSSFDDPGGPGPVPGWVEGQATGECTFRCLRHFTKFDSRLIINCVNEAECNPVTGNGIEIAVGSGSVDVGSIDVPVSVQRVDVLKVDGDPSQLAGLDLTLAWDPALASLSDVLLTPATQDWFMEFLAGVGTVDISMASLDVIDVPPDVLLDVLQLRFDAPGVEGQTPLMVVDSRAFDLDQNPIPHRTVDGELITGCAKGDVIPDGEINSADGIRALLIAMEMLVPTDQEFCAADMNSDGIVDPGDVVQLLQRAVGIMPTGTTAGEPLVYLRSGDALGDVIVHVENVAALEMKMTFDPAEVSFVSASAPGSKGLTAANDADPGVVRLGFARATSYDGDILLHFDVSQTHTAMSVTEAWVYDELGQKQPITLLSDQFVFGVTAADGPGGLDRTRLLASIPNPFNPRTDLRFSLPDAGDAQLRVFDSAGRLVREFQLRGLSAGEHSVTWDGHDDAGARVASGAYIVQLVAGQRTDTGRVVLVK